jgi:four helix bundle protein
MTDNELSERLLDLAVRVAKVVDALPRTKMGQHAAGQLARSGTSAGPNYEEGCAAESRADFIHKLGIVLKELRESRFWLRFIAKAGLLRPKLLVGLIDECGQLCDIIGKSIVTAKRNRNREPQN